MFKKFLNFVFFMPAEVERLLVLQGGIMPNHHENNYWQKPDFKIE